MMPYLLDLGGFLQVYTGSLPALYFIPVPTGL